MAVSQSMTYLTFDISPCDSRYIFFPELNSWSIVDLIWLPIMKASVKYLEVINTEL